MTTQDPLHILIIGAAGMIGRKLTQRLIADGSLNGRPIGALTLADIIAPETPAFSGKVATHAADLSQTGVAEILVAGKPDVIYHLAAIVSGEAEADFEKGYRVNLDGTRNLFEAIRQGGGGQDGWLPRVVFTSSIAVYGAPFPETIEDDQLLSPLTSYGTQKAIGEMLLADYSRRGFFDGIGVRLPTIAIRPGKPNAAASGFFSSILREPLAGLPANLPVEDSVRHWFASPRAAVRFLIHAAGVDTAQLGVRRSMALPGVSATVAEEIAALGRVAGEKATALITREPDATVARIVAGWPQGFNPARALALGFKAEASMDEIIKAHVEDELGGKIGG